MKMKYIVMTAPEDGDCYSPCVTYSSLASARRAAKDKVIGNGPITKCGMPSWAFYLDSAIEAWADRDSGEDSPIAVISTLPVEWSDDVA